MRVFVAGDFCPRYRIENMLSMKDYSFFDSVRNILSQSDYSIVNLECPIVEHYIKPITKCGPALFTSLNVVNALKYAGFDCVTLANNHFRDFGDEGCMTTINELKKHNIDFVGGGRNLEDAQKILYKSINGKTLAIVNFCENEFSIATDKQAGAAPLDAVDNYNQITEARRNADYVLVIVHGGHEHYQLPSLRMKNLYRHFVTIGADAVVNHHQHCYSGYEYFKGKPIIYGLGNFCFDNNKRNISIWNEGYVIALSFTNEVNIELYPYIQCAQNSVVEFMDNASKDIFYNNIEKLNSIIIDNQKLQEKFNEFCSGHSNTIKRILAPHCNKFLNAAASRGWIPTRYIKFSDWLLIYDYIKCESLRDIILQTLK